MTNATLDTQIAFEANGNSGLAASAMDTKLGKAVVRGTPLLTGVAVACGCAYVGLSDPSARNLTPTCSFYLLTGFYCPGCGMTRATHNLLNLNFLKAFQFNALLVVSIPVLVYLYVWWMTWAYSGKELPKLKVSKKISIALVALAILFTVGRNFPEQLPEFFAKDHI